MTRSGKREKKYDEERVDAVSALYLSAEVDSTSCLTSEELAQFVENKSDETLRDRCISHIGSCSECYEEWLQLKSEHILDDKKSKPHNIMRYFTSRKSLVTAGSTVGIAVAVAIFLNIEITPDLMQYKKKTEVEQSMPTEQELLKEIETESIEVGRQEVSDQPAEGKFAAPRQLPQPVSPSPQKYSEDLHYSPKSSAEQEKEIAGGDKKDSTEKLKVSKPRAVSTAKYMESKREVHTSQWFEELASACRSREKQTGVYNQLLQKMRDNSNNRQDRRFSDEQFLELLDLTSRIVASGYQEEICVRIEKIIME